MADANPYIGPTSFEERHSSYFFGRDEETRELVSLIIARRAVLLYAQSGAGKTSLLKASVIPSLKRRKRMDVFPIARVVGAATPGEGNLYVANALAHLTGSAPADFAGQPMKEALGPMLDRGGPRTARLLVFDQFEEIFTWYPERYAERKEFFQQLDDCLNEYPQLSLVLSMREDYLADIDSFASFLPDRMRTRMRLERLPYQAAVAAVSKPAAMGGKPFAQGVAERLVDNLRRVQVRGREGNHALGKYVEPVQLQIVCWQLWSHLPQEAAEITDREVEEYGDVDDALTKFYADALSEVRKATSVTERALRRWFSEELITPARTRGLVYGGDIDTAGLPNEAVAVLRDRYIIRADVRGCNTWYELAHDRLVEPILEDNQNWRANYRNPVAEACERWEAAGRDPKRLLYGNQLVDARGYAVVHPNELSAEERRFLETCIEEEKRTKQRKRTFRLTSTAVGLALIALAVWALLERAKAASMLVAMQKASSRLFLQETGRVWQDEPDEGLAYAEQALRYEPDSLPASSWVSSLLLRRSWWLPGPVMQPQEADGSRKETVGSVGFSPDGQRIITASGTTVAIWDAGSGKPLGTPVRVPDSASFVAFSPDGRRFVTFSTFMVRVWTAGSDKPDFEKELNGLIEYARFSPDGRQIVTVSVDWSSPGEAHGASAEVWDIAARERVSVVHERSRMHAAAFSPDGRELLTWSDNFLSRSEVSTGKRLRSVELPASVSSANFSFDATRVVTTHPNGMVEVRDADTGALAGSPMQHQGVVSSAALSRDGRYVVTGSDDKTARVWTVETATFLGIVGRHKGFACAGTAPGVADAQGKISAVAFSPDGRRIVTGSDDCTARVWETLSGQPLSTPQEERRYALKLRDRTKQPNNVSAFAGAFSPDGTRLIGIAAGVAQVWNTETGEQIGEQLRHEDDITSVMFSGDGHRIVTASAKGARIWQAGTGRLLLPITPKSSSGFRTAAFSPDGRSIVTTGGTGLEVWDAQSGEWRGTPKAGDGTELRSGSYNPDGKLLLISTSAGLIGLFGGEADRKMHTNRAVMSAVFSPKRDRVVSADAGGRAIIWDVNKQLPVGRPMGHANSVYSAGFSSDGQLVVTASADGTAQVWNAENGHAIGVPIAHPGEVLWAGFAPDGKRVATVSRDGMARLWTVLLGDGSPKDAALLIDLAAAASGRFGSMDAATRVEKIRELRGEVSGRYPAGSPLRRLLGMDRPL